MKIFFSGGGTLGSVIPLLAIKEHIEQKYNNTTFFWCGTKRGIENDIVKKQHIPFFPLYCGKLRRYFSITTVLDGVGIIVGIAQSLYLLKKHAPDVCISAGGFVSFPLHVAAKILGIPTWVHQQDIHVGLANKLLAPFASCVTVSVSELQKKFPKKEVCVLGNPVRKNIYTGDKNKAREIFRLQKNIPVVFVTGGGTGAIKLNEMIYDVLPQLIGKCQLVHLTGKNRGSKQVVNLKKQYSWYHPYEFLSENIHHLYAIADIVIFRGGFGTITELAALEKAAICIPKPGHQEKNAAYFAEKKALITVSENTESQILVRHITNLLDSEKKRTSIGKALFQALSMTKKEDVESLLDSLLSKKNT
ncbi:MAG: hypothetical protein CL685_02380 [Candidatus Magasanikbacteria bacterium]|nr:hypothetical protein [Candidatus Magasanikbacteria bacterium]|tara:strand:- start:3848 stop:4930 length:1083 start_codon:yes stop_codon:yes gene_type:complete